MPDIAFTEAQLEQLRSVFREELADAGLRIDGPDHVDDAREDFRFLRRLRKNYDGAATQVGRWVIGGLLTILGSILALGFWSWLSRGGH